MFIKHQIAHRSDKVRYCYNSLLKIVAWSLLSNMAVTGHVWLWSSWNMPGPSEKGRKYKLHSDFWLLIMGKDIRYINNGLYWLYFWSDNILATWAYINISSTFFFFSLFFIVTRTFKTLQKAHIIILLDCTGLNRWMLIKMLCMCFELQLMVPGINIILIIDLYLAYFGKIF